MICVYSEHRHFKRKQKKYMKKHEPTHLLVLLAIFIGGFFALVGMQRAEAIANEVKIYLAPASISVSRGEAFAVQVRIGKQGNEKVDYVTAYIAFPTSQMEVASIRSAHTAFSKNNSFRSTHNNASGTINITGSSETLGTNVDVYVATVTFRSKTDGRAIVQFTEDTKVGSLLGSGGIKNALDATSHAVITVNPPPQTPVSQPVVTPEPVRPQSAPTPALASAPESVTIQPEEEVVTNLPENQEDKTEGTVNTAPENTEITTMSKRTEGQDLPGSTSTKPVLLWAGVGAVGVAGLAGVALLAMRRKKHTPTEEVVEEYHEGVDTQYVENAPLEVVENARVESAGVYPSFAPAVVEELPPDFPMETVLDDTEVNSLNLTLNTPSPNDVAGVSLPQNNEAKFAEEVASGAATPDPVQPVAQAMTAPNISETMQTEIASDQALTATTTNPAHMDELSEYKNMPDMFEVGERRLADAGLSDKLHIPARPASLPR